MKWTSCPSAVACKTLEGCKKKGHRVVRRGAEKAYQSRALVVVSAHATTRRQVCLHHGAMPSLEKRRTSGRLSSERATDGPCCFFRSSGPTHRKSSACIIQSHLFSPFFQNESCSRAPASPSRVQVRSSRIPARTIATRHWLGVRVKKPHHLRNIPQIPARE